ncbi:MAG: nucleotidyl transferase AbiEii/AbiGii toxin family protein [Deltaproteobacteria bacterium]|nr:nucleotidyl transferase AbiEii/AbiGii toxin family protein [Deltaproteobacteria bacterium]
MIEQQYIETFQLLFLRQLGERLDKNHYALKGGCNLRFYLKSIRYSEDIDFDVKIIAKDTLKLNVRKILAAPSFIKTLASKGISIVEKSEPKQSETTQRWKVAFQVTGSQLSIHTKIEFSRRNLDSGTSFEAVDSDLTHGYGLYPVYSNHYDKHTAFHQKIDALIQRTETQARDIFDLELLLTAGATISPTAGTDKESLEKAQNNARSVSYKDFTSQVLAYLLPAFRSGYPEERWNKTVEKTVNLLERMKS